VFSKKKAPAMPRLDATLLNLVEAGGLEPPLPGSEPGFLPLKDISTENWLDEKDSNLHRLIQSQPCCQLHYRPTEIGPEPLSRTVSFPASTGGATLTPAGDWSHRRSRTVLFRVALSGVIDGSENGGRREIRTHDTLRCSCFRDRCNQPLCQPSLKWRRARESNSVLPLSDRGPFSRRLTAIGPRTPLKLGGWSVIRTRTTFRLTQS
jgi:hypothetical protein